MSKIAIIGFGAAGYHAAKEARKTSSDIYIDVYSNTNISPYNPMLTTYYISGAIPYSAMFPFGPTEQIAADLNIRCYENQPVTSLLPAEKKLILSDGTERLYDRILISTGASAVVPQIPGASLPGVFKMRTVQDAVALKKYLETGRCKRGLVIGASWVGIKVVEDLVSYQVDCTLVDGAPWPFYVATFAETAQRIQQALEARNIQVACNQMLSHIQQEADGTLTAVMQNGNHFSADLIAICVGVRANVDLVKDSGIKIGRGIQVDQRMRTNYEGIYAAADCCEALDIQSNQPRNIGVWLNACKQGKVAGANIAGRHLEFDANLLVNLGHYLNYDFISIGDIQSCAEDDTVYEYEDSHYYIRAARSAAGIKCINMIGSANINGIIKNIFIKSIESPEAALDIRTCCYLYDQGIPSSFLDFLRGRFDD